MNKIKLKEENIKRITFKSLFKKVKKSFLDIIFFPVLFSLVGTGIALTTSKTLYSSTGTLLFTSSAHQSSIMAMANMSSSDIVYEKTYEDLKSKEILINNSNIYSLSNLKNSTKITPILTSNTIQFKCTLIDKDSVKVVVDCMLDNAIKYGIDYPLFKNSIKINNYGSDPKLISNGIQCKILASFGVGLIFGTFSILFKCFYRRKIYDESDLLQLNLPLLLIDDKKLIEHDLRDLETELAISSTDDKGQFIVFSPDNQFNINGFELIADSIESGKKQLIINLLFNANESKISDNFEIKAVSNTVDLLCFKSDKAILYFKNEDYIKFYNELKAKYDNIFIICQSNLFSCEIELLMNYTNSVIMFIEEGKTNYNQFVYSYNSLPETSSISIIYSK